MITRMRGAMAMISGIGLMMLLTICLLMGIRVGPMMVPSIRGMMGLRIGHMVMLILALRMVNRVANRAILCVGRFVSLGITLMLIAMMGLGLCFRVVLLSVRTRVVILNVRARVVLRVCGLGVGARLMIFPVGWRGQGRCSHKKAHKRHGSGELHDERVQY